MLPERAGFGSGQGTGREMAIITDEQAALRILREARRVAVLGIKTEAQGSAAGYYVPAYLQRAGYEIVPVPV
jgi:uncharacterized protein